MGATYQVLQPLSNAEYNLQLNVGMPILTSQQIPNAEHKLQISVGMPILVSQPLHMQITTYV